MRDCKPPEYSYIPLSLYSGGSLVFSLLVRMLRGVEGRSLSGLLLSGCAPLGTPDLRARKLRNGAILGQC